MGPEIAAVVQELSVCTAVDGGGERGIVVELRVLEDAKLPFWISSNQARRLVVELAGALSIEGDDIAQGILEGLARLGDGPPKFDFNRVELN